MTDDYEYATATFTLWNADNSQSDVSNIMWLFLTRLCFWTSLLALASSWQLWLGNSWTAKYFCFLVIYFRQYHFEWYETKRFYRNTQGGLMKNNLCCQGWLQVWEHCIVISVFTLLVDVGQVSQQRVCVSLQLISVILYGYVTLYVKTNWSGTDPPHTKKNYSSVLWITKKGFS